MLIELSARERYDAERALPPIFTTRAQRYAGTWTGNFYADRIDWYTRLTIESELILGGVTVIPEFIAAMIGEAGLNNRVQGDSDASNPHMGFYWVQLDTEHHAPQLTSELIRFRSDPLLPLQYVAATRDLCRHTPNRTEFNRQRWHAWEPETIDPSPVNGAAQWSPFRAALDAYHRVTAAP